MRQTVIGLCFFIGLAAGSNSVGQVVTPNNNLVFGAVFAGIPNTVSKDAAGAAAEFVVAGSAGAEATVQFTFLPTYMNSGGSNMRMIFTQTDCAIDSSSTPDQSNPAWDNLNPRNANTVVLGSGGLTVWLGGTVIPEIIQPPGNYSGIIEITVAYTGN